MPESSLPDSSIRPALGELTVAEALIWTGQRLEPESPLYNMALAFRIRGAVDPRILGEALGRLVAREPALRTTYAPSGDGAVRVVHDHVDIPLEVLDLPAGEVDDRSVLDRLEERTRRVLPLEGPLLDVCLVRRAPDRSVLYINQHHIATDASSTGILYRRLGDAYREVAESAPPPPPSPSYLDWARRPRGPREAERLDRALEFWARDAENYRATLPLYGREGPGSGRTERIRRPLGRGRSEALHRLASAPPFRALTREQSRYLVFATTLLAWLHRASDERAVALGSPWHHRPSEALRETLGLFIELLPLRVEIDDDETFTSLGRKVAAASMETLRHAVPGASRSPRARGYGVVLNYITARTGPFAGMPAEADWIHSGYGDPEHRVRLQVHDFDEAGEPTLDFDLDVEAFDEEARGWPVDHFLRLFDALAEDPDQSIRGVALVTPEEEAGFAPPGAPHPPVPTVVESIRSIAADHPDAVAVADGARSLSYRQLASDTARLATALVRRGVGPGDVVGLVLPPSPEFLTALLAVLDAGAAYLPLDPQHPKERVEALVADAGASLVITAGGDVDPVAGSAPTVGWDTLAAEGDRGGDPGPSDRIPAGTDLAYVLYTSGSTGRPKGVEVSHDALAEYAHWAVRTYAPDGPVRMPFFTSPAFDLTVTSLFTPLLSGGTVVVHRPDAAEPAEAGALLVRQVFQDHRLDLAKVTPSHLALIRDLDLSGSRLRRLVVGGEDLKTATARRVHDAFGGAVAIFNEYGPTEATVGCMIHRYDPEVDTGRSVPIGVPADNMAIRVADDAGRPLPRGVEGEICIRGPRLARGYRDRPERTAAAFAPMPDEPARRMYRTGDRGRWTPDGVLEYLGRDDDQVKVRGVRLELGEVEAALGRHPAVRDSVAHLVTSPTPSHTHCIRCGLQAAHPEAHMDDDGVCAVCRRFERERERIDAYFGEEDDLARLLEEARAAARGPHDTLMLYSGGKDSTYALCRIVEMGANPLVFLLDNGFISDQAKTNVRRVVDQLGLDLHVAETPAMPAIFADSLTRFSNVCQGCFKAIYTLALNVAVERGIPALVTGLSRGQIFETRLADLYRRGVYEPDEADRTILEARKAYHRMDDAVARTLDVSIFETDDVLDRIRFIDFYRYVDVDLDELLAYVAKHTPWIRPSDTGRSTNCLINDAGIYVHTTERGFHNYTLPYSWDVRLGHKERDAALAELDDQLDPAQVRRMLDEVGYREHAAPEPEARLVAYYTADADVPAADLRRSLAATLPREAIPGSFVRLEEIPLTPHGKVDRNALPQPASDRPLLEGLFIAPRTPDERLLAEIWADVLGIHEIGVEDDFFELGGDSMHCIQIVATARDRGLVFSPRDLFAHPTVAELAALSTHGDRHASSEAPEAASASADELAELAEEFGD